MAIEIKGNAAILSAQVKQALPQTKKIPKNKVRAAWFNAELFISIFFNNYFDVCGMPSCFHTF
jgi:hypothetical protein